MSRALRHTVTLAALLLLCTWKSSDAVGGDRQKNWGGLPDAVTERAMPLNTQPVDFDPATGAWVEKVGDSPQVYYFHNFLTDSERAHIIQVAAPQMRRSTVVGQKGASVVDDIRTSYGMFIRRLHDPIIERIERRISLWTHVPLEHQEDIQVLRYVKGQKYGAHYDSSYDKSEVNGPKFRLATFYLYLSDVEEGGETAFPQGSKWTDPSMGTKGGPWSDCAKGNVAAKPKANDAVLFYSYYPNGTMDTASMHTGCPVVKGIKWGAPIWIHVDEFRPEELIGRKSSTKDPVPTRDPGACADYNSRCASFVAAGECDKNVEFMMDMCRRACKECELCGANEWECINRNRKKGGFLEIDSEEMRWLGVDLWQVPEPSPEL